MTPSSKLKVRTRRKGVLHVAVGALVWVVALLVPSKVYGSNMYDHLKEKETALSKSRFLLPNRTKTNSIDTAHMYANINATNSSNNSGRNDTMVYIETDFIHVNFNITNGTDYRRNGTNITNGVNYNKNGTNFTNGAENRKNGTWSRTPIKSNDTNMVRNTTSGTNSSVEETGGSSNPFNDSTLGAMILLLGVGLPVATALILFAAAIQTKKKRTLLTVKNLNCETCLDSRWQRSSKDKNLIAMIPNDLEKREEIVIMPNPKDLGGKVLTMDVHRCTSAACSRCVNAGRDSNKRCIFIPSE